MARAKCGLCLEQCSTWLKPYASRISMGEWKNETAEELVEGFSSFFLAVGSSSRRLNSKLVASAAASLTELSPEEASTFGFKVAQAFTLAMKRARGTGARQTGVMASLIKLLGINKGGPNQSPGPHSSPSFEDSCPPSEQSPSNLPLSIEEDEDDEVECAMVGKSSAPSTRSLPSGASSSTMVFKDPLTLLREISQQAPTTSNRKSSASSSGEMPTVEVLSSQESLPPKPSMIQSHYVDPTTMKMVLVLEDSILQEVDMKEGSSGFAECVFGGKTIVSTMPNLILQSKTAPAKKSRAMKRPAACIEAQDEEEYACDGEQQEPAQAPPTTEPPKFAIMFYKANGSWGLRQKYGAKKQVMAVCKTKAPADALEAIARKCLEKLNQGDEVSEVRKWSKEQLADL